ncbi:MAG TPA: DNA alkylation repair protein [Gemmatimonadales bacterium]
MTRGQPGPNPTSATIRSALRRSASWTVPQWRTLRRDWSRALRSRPASEVIRLALELVRDGGWGRLTAYELVASHPGGISALTPAAVARLGTGIADWVSADTFGCYVAGPAWREGRLPTRVVHGWLGSPDRWQRRVGVVCTVALNVRARGGRGDPARTLAVCRRVVTDRDDMVVKALSWALRSLVEWDRDAVAEFLEAHDEDLASRIKREVRTKLRTGLKN